MNAVLAMDGTASQATRSTLAVPLATGAKRALKDIEST
jgi:hypothetical protein